MCQRHILAGGGAGAAALAGTRCVALGGVWGRVGALSTRMFVLGFVAKIERRLKMCWYHFALLLCHARVVFLPPDQPPRGVNLFITCPNKKITFKLTTCLFIRTHLIHCATLQPRMFSLVKMHLLNMQTWVYLKVPY